MNTATSASPLRTLHERLQGIPWSDHAGSHAAAQSILDEVIDTRAPLRDLGLDPTAAATLQRSVEKTTHFKWFVVDDQLGFEIWLHQYKPSTHRRIGHATVAHDHRFWFTSLLLRGGFESHSYEPCHHRAARLRQIGSTEYKQGDSYVMNPETIHSLSDLQENTLSLLVQSKPVRSYSNVYENGRVLRYYDLESQLASLVGEDSFSA